MHRGPSTDIELLKVRFDAHKSSLLATRHVCIVCIHLSHAVRVSNIPSDLCSSLNRPKQTIWRPPAGLVGIPQSSGCWQPPHSQPLNLCCVTGVLVSPTDEWGLKSDSCR